jgi:hypothetical protein
MYCLSQRKKENVLAAGGAIKTNQFLVLDALSNTVKY